MILGLAGFFHSQRSDRHLEVPVPKDLDKLEPQLRNYVTQKIKWVRERPREMHRQATLGIIYAANSLWSEARLAFINAAKLNPKEPLARLYVAISTQESGDFNEALNMFRQITAEFPEFPQGYYRLGDALLRSGSVDEAEPAFQRLIALAPKEWRGYAGMGEVKLRKGDYAEAAKVLEKSLALDPGAKTAHHLLGQAYRGLGRLEDAGLELAIGVDQTRYPMEDDWSVTASQHMKLLQDQMDMANEYSSRGQPGKAVELLKEALASQQGNSSLVNALAIAYNRSGQPENARDLLLKVVQKEDRYLPAYITLSHSCSDLGRTNEALRYAERAIELGPNVAQTHLAKANALLTMEHDEQALAALEVALRCDPQNGEIQMEMGDVCLKNLNRSEPALEHYKQAARLNPALASVQVRLAQLYVERGDAGEAGAAVEHLRRISPANPALGILDERLRRLAGRRNNE